VPVNAHSVSHSLLICEETAESSPKSAPTRARGAISFLTRPRAPTAQLACTRLHSRPGFTDIAEPYEIVTTSEILWLRDIFIASFWALPSLDLLVLTAARNEPLFCASSVA
jgi:hypothetical protein